MSLPGGSEDVQGFKVVVVVLDFGAFHDVGSPSWTGCRRSHHDPGDGVQGPQDSIRPGRDQSIRSPGPGIPLVKWLSGRRGDVRVQSLLDRVGFWPAPAAARPQAGDWISGAE